MKLPLQIFSWIGVVVGLLAILSGAASTDGTGGSAIIGGVLFFVQGLFALLYINEVQS